MWLEFDCARRFCSAKTPLTAGQDRYRQNRLTERINGHLHEQLDEQNCGHAAYCGPPDSLAVQATQSLQQLRLVCCTRSTNDAIPGLHDSNEAAVGNLSK